MTKATRDDAPRRLASKVDLVRQLYARGYKPEDLLELFRLIDWLLTLPKPMARSFRQKVDEIEQESKMKYVTSIERLSREDGLNEGFQTVVLSQMEERFGPLDDTHLKTVEKVSRKQILQWAKRILTASTLDEVFAT